PQRREVLPQADRRHHAGQLARRPYAEQPETEPRPPVQLEVPADGADRERQLRPSDQLVALDLPAAERSVATGARGMGVRARLEAAPVLAGGERDRVDAVHEALVVGRGAVRV